MNCLTANWDCLTAGVILCFILRSLKEYQDFKAPNSRNWCPFKIGDVQYFAIAITKPKLNCPIYYWSAQESRFIRFKQDLPCSQAHDVAAFMLNNAQHIVISNYDPSSSVGIFRWNGTGFTTLQRIRATAIYVEPFKIGEDNYIALSGTLFDHTLYTRKTGLNRFELTR